MMKSHKLVGVNGKGAIHITGTFPGSFKELLVGLILLIHFCRCIRQSCLIYFFPGLVNYRYSMIAEKGRDRDL